VIRLSGATIAILRPTVDFGETDYTPAGSVADAVVVPPQLFVPRGSDVKVGDKFTHQNVTYFVTGSVQWDMDHPMSGEDLGYVEYEIGTEKGPGNAG
jgi:hypothetical protein